MVFSGPALWDCTCDYCGKTIFRGEYCVKVGLFKAKYYHNECYGRTKSGEPPEQAKNYCTSCGARILAESKFCSKCGASITAPVSPRIPAKPESKTGRNILIVIVLVFLLLVVGALGYGIYEASKPPPSTPMPTPTPTPPMPTPTSTPTPRPSPGPRELQVSLSVSDERISTGAIQWISIKVTWESSAVVADVTIIIQDPDGKVVHNYSRETSDSGIINHYWNVPKDATLGVYTVHVIATKTQYLPGEASIQFEVI